MWYNHKISCNSVINCIIKLEKMWIKRYNNYNVIKIDNRGGSIEEINNEWTNKMERK